MPESKFRELAEQGYTIDELSEVFIVPKGQVCARLDELCKNYTELNDKIKELEKELLELKNKKNNLNEEI